MLRQEYNDAIKREELLKETTTIGLVITIGVVVICVGCGLSLFLFDKKYDGTIVENIKKVTNIQMLCSPEVIDRAVQDGKVGEGKEIEVGDSS